MRAIVLNNFVTAQVGISLAIGGCTADLDKARRLQPVGATFAAELAREYRDFALSEADDMYDWPDAFHFAVKALAAGHRGARPSALRLLARTAGGRLADGPYRRLS